MTLLEIFVYGFIIIYTLFMVAAILHINRKLRQYDKIMKQLSNRKELKAHDKKN